MIKNYLAPQVGNKKTIPVAFFICNNRFAGAIFLTSVWNKNGAWLPLLGVTPPSRRVFSFLKSNHFLMIGISAKIEERGVAVYQHGPILRPSLFNLPVIGKEVKMVKNMEIPLSRNPKRKNTFGRKVLKTFKQWKSDRKEVKL